jgi:hypothetical protein
VTAQPSRDESDEMNWFEKRFTERRKPRTIEL